MIDYHQFAQIKDLHDREGLKASQIADILGLDPRTVTYWLAQERFRPRRTAHRVSKLEPFKPQIRQMLEKYPYSAVQVWQRLSEQGFEGSYSTVKAYVRTVRPRRRRARAIDSREVAWSSTTTATPSSLPWSVTRTPFRRSGR